MLIRARSRSLGPRARRLRRGEARARHSPVSARPAEQGGSGARSGTSRRCSASPMTSYGGAERDRTCYRPRVPSRTPPPPETASPLGNNCFAQRVVPRAGPPGSQPTHSESYLTNPPRESLSRTRAHLPSNPSTHGADFLRERHADPEPTQPLGADRRTSSAPRAGWRAGMEASPAVLPARSFGRRQGISYQQVAERRLPSERVQKSPALAPVCHFEGGATPDHRLARNPARRLRNLLSATGALSHRSGTGPVRPCRSREAGTGCRVGPPAIRQ
jgi:hypothetical protein